MPCHALQYYPGESGTRPGLQNGRPCSLTYVSVLAVPDWVFPPPSLHIDRKVERNKQSGATQSKVQQSLQCISPSRRASPLCLPSMDMVDSGKARARERKEELPLPADLRGISFPLITGPARLRHG
jgi:hypothetical protein